MAGTTTNGLPYPTGTDLIMNGDNAIQALAEAVDAGQRWGDTGTINVIAAGFSLVAGFTGLIGSVRRRNGLVTANMQWVSTNAIAAGDVANISVVNVPAGWVPFNNGTLVSAGVGPGIFFTVEGATIKITAVATAVAAGSSISANGLWMV